MALDILAVGGGSIATGETEAIDRLFVSRCASPNPKVLFVPTASDDSPEYSSQFQTTYGALGCEVRSLNLYSEPSDGASELTWADAVYVGGGNTKAMLEVWSRVGFAANLCAAANAGMPVGGTSAGAICWFRVGNSDWPQYEQIPDVLTDRLDCLGLVDLILCPHASREPFRLGDFRRMMRAESGVGVALDDCCAIHVLGDSYRIVSFQPLAVAHRIEWIGGELNESILTPMTEFAPLSSL